MINLLRNTLSLIKPLDIAAMDDARKRQNTLTKPPGSLGCLEELSIRIAGIQSKAIPKGDKKTIITMAGDHGVVAENIGNWPQEVTTQMVMNFIKGGAGINVLARHIGARVITVDMGIISNIPPTPGLLIRKINRGTDNIVTGPAMSQEQAVKSIETGIDVVNHECTRGLDMVGTGDMGIGNTTPSSAICSVITGFPPAKVTGKGTGISDKQLLRKIEVIEKAISVNSPDPKNPIEVLAKVGGFEIGGLAGIMIGAAAHRVPVIVDGFISGAAALIATSISPLVSEYLIQSHISTEPGHRIMLDYMGLKPLLALDMRLGEGTGAALGIYLTEASIKLLNEMATFNEAGVAESKY